MLGHDRAEFSLDSASSTSDSTDSVVKVHAGFCHPASGALALKS